MSFVLPCLELTQVPRGQRRTRGGGGLRLVGAEDGAIRLVVDQVGHEGTLLVLGEGCGVASCRAQTGLMVGVAARGVTAHRSLVSAMGARLEGRQGEGVRTSHCNSHCMGM